jgi:hypothetical protein
MNQDQQRSKTEDENDDEDDWGSKQRFVLNHRPQNEKPPSHSATPELLQLLTS